MPRGPVTRAERLTDRAKISWVIVAVGEAAWSESPPARRGGVLHRPSEARKEPSEGDPHAAPLQRFQAPRRHRDAAVSPILVRAGVCHAVPPACAVSRVRAPLRTRA
jgi:hypothetical protein